MECQAEELAQWPNQQLVAGSLLNYFTQQFYTLSLYEHKDLSKPYGPACRAL